MQTTPNPCKFCALLAAGPLATTLPNLVMENEQVAVAVNRRPAAAGHLTLILKRHHARTSEFRDGDWSGVGSLVGKISGALEAKYSPHRVIFLADGKRSSHLHLHLIPEPAGATLALGEVVADLNEAVRPSTIGDVEVATLVGELRAALA